MGHVVMRSFSSALDDGLRRRSSLEKFFWGVKAPALSSAHRLSRLLCISIDCAKPDVYSSECSPAAHSLIGVSLPLRGDPDIWLYPMRSLRKKKKNSIEAHCVRRWCVFLRGVGGTQVS